MEGSDVFAGAGVEVGQEQDPFGGGEDWAGFGVEGQQAPVTEQPPVVDREGAPVPATTGSDGAPKDPRAMSEEELARAEEGYQYRVSHGEPVPPEAEAAHAHYLATRRHEEEVHEGALTPAAVEPDLPPAPEAPSPADGPQEAQEPAPEPVAAEAPAPEAQAPEEDAPEPEEDAPVPEETTSPSGKTTHRRYVVLQATETGRFEQLAWYEDKSGKMVSRGTSGAKRQTVALSRGTDDALKVGYLALGSPPEGVTLVAVAALHFQPRRVRPKPPEPSRTRLEIS